MLDSHNGIQHNDFLLPWQSDTMHDIMCHVVIEEKILDY